MRPRRRCGEGKEPPPTGGAAGSSLLALATIDLVAFAAAAWLCLSVPESLEPSAPAAAPAAEWVDFRSTSCR
jgi:hypothetical protein